jgi:hypothetical protein
MSRVLLTIVRLALSAWVGAALLFVVNAVRQVTSEWFDSTTRHQLALLRFPPYYLFGFTLVGLGCAGLLALTLLEARSRRRWAVALLLAASALVVMLADYWWVYLPLESMLTPPQRAVPADFVKLHRLSELVNTVHLSLALAAALAVDWPESRREFRGGDNVPGPAVEDLRADL